MEFTEKDVKKFSVIILVVLLIFLSFLVIKQFLTSIVSGLILAFIFFPIYRWLNKYIKNKGAAAFLITILILASVFAILWFATPILLKQLFEFLLTIQKVDLQAVVKSLFPSASDAFTSQMVITFQNTIGAAFSAGSNALKGFLTDLPQILLDFFILGFVFFFALRDSDRLKSFAKGISPLNENKEKIVVQHFKDMTGAIIYGWVIVGLIQGTLAGIGFFIFGIDNALILTALAIFLSIIPFLGPAFVWVPVAIYILTTGDMTLFIGYILYNLIIVSLVDNIIRSYIIARKTKVHSAVILVGMLGGILAFGAVGLIIGPLLLAYLLTLIESFKDKSIYSLFT